MRAPSVLALAILAGIGLAPRPAEAQVVQAGALTCDVAPGFGFLVGSRKEIVCTFRNVAGDLEIYDGSITKLGVDIGVTDRFVIVWNVLAPSGRVVRGALSGSYFGATAQATVGAGIGANVLVGGFERSLTLQPVSVSAQTGVNVAAGVAELALTLRPDPARRR